MLRKRLLALGIFFLFQKPFYSSQRCFIVDFYFVLAQGKLVVELDGNSHNSQKSKKWDWDRTVFLTNRRKCKVIRFKNEQVYHSLDAVIDAILSYSPRTITQQRAEKVLNSAMFQRRIDPSEIFLYE